MNDTALLYSLAAFGLYTLALILLAGRSFSWRENRRLFYVGRGRIPLLSSIATFCATWMSGASLVGFTMYLYLSGYEAFTGSVHGWLLGLVFLPFIVLRLRSRPVLSLPEWLAEEYGDQRLRTISALSLVLAYTFYIVIQFLVFAKVVGYMLDIAYPLASLLVYLFVLYTTFGGMPAVVRSDMLNMAVILPGVSIAGWIIFHNAGGLGAIHAEVFARDPSMLAITSREGLLFTLAMMLGWGFGVAANPQYAIRIISARSSRTAWKMLAAAGIVVSWIYICLTVIGLGGRAQLTMDIPFGREAGFAQIFSTILPPVPSMLLLLAVLAASVSTANSQLLLAACSWCYDFRRENNRPDKDPLREDRFIFNNRVAITAISTAALIISFFNLPGILILGRYSWSVVAICFLLPLYLPFRLGGRGLFVAIASALVLHTLLVLFGGKLPEIGMLYALFLEAVIWVCASMGERR